MDNEKCLGSSQRQSRLRDGDGRGLPQFAGFLRLVNRHPNIFQTAIKRRSFALPARFAGATNDKRGRREISSRSRHAAPRDPLYEYLNGDADEAIWRAAVGKLAEREAWLFLGHTHRPFVRRIGRLTVVNPGSLGMPVDGDSRGCYAVWENGEISLKRIGYDVERAVKRLFDSGLPEDVAAKMSAVLRHAGRGG